MNYLYISPFYVNDSNIMYCTLICDNSNFKVKNKRSSVAVVVAVAVVLNGMQEDPITQTGRSLIRGANRLYELWPTVRELPERLEYGPVCGLPERVELQTSVWTTRESRVTDQCVNYQRESSYRPVCELPERVELQTSVWTTRETRVQTSV